MSNLLPNDYFCWHTLNNIKPLEPLISFLNETKKDAYYWLMFFYLPLYDRKHSNASLLTTTMH